MSITKSCDLCKHLAEGPTFKLFLGVVAPNLSPIHSNYSHHADICNECKEKLMKIIKFKKRMTASEYHSRGNHGK